MHKQTEIAKRLSAICAQLVPYLSQEHQQQVSAAIERAKQVTANDLSAIGVYNHFPFDCFKLTRYLFTKATTHTRTFPVSTSARPPSLTPGEPGRPGWPRRPSTGRLGGARRRGWSRTGPANTCSAGRTQLGSASTRLGGGRAWWSRSGRPGGHDGPRSIRSLSEPGGAQPRRSAEQQPDQGGQRGPHARLCLARRSASTPPTTAAAAAATSQQPRHSRPQQVAVVRAQPPRAQEDQARDARVYEHPTTTTTAATATATTATTTATTAAAANAATSAAASATHTASAATAARTRARSTGIRKSSSISVFVFEFFSIITFVISIDGRTRRGPRHRQRQVGQ